jgi:hypothetical protein
MSGEARKPVAETRPRQRKPYPFEPLTMTWAEVAGVVFRSSESWLRDHIGEYAGFPQPDRSLDVFAREAVETWVRARFGLAAAEPAAQSGEALLLSRINARTSGPLPRRPTA